MPKPAPVTSLNVRRKGEAAPAVDAVARGAAPVPDKVSTPDLVPLSFKVPPAFKKRYQQAALDAGMKLNEFLASLLDAHEKRKS